MGSSIKSNEVYFETIKTDNLKVDKKFFMKRPRSKSLGLKENSKIKNEGNNISEVFTSIKNENSNKMLQINNFDQELKKINKIGEVKGIECSKLKYLKVFFYLNLEWRVKKY